MRILTNPHIFFDRGYWRVTPVPIGTVAGSMRMQRFVLANNFTCKLNARILIGQRTEYRNRHKEQ